MGITIHIFKFKKQQNKKQEAKEAKEINEQKRISAQNRFAAARVKIFLVTRISGNKSIICFGLMLNVFVDIAYAI